MIFIDGIRLGALMGVNFDLLDFMLLFVISLRRKENFCQIKFGHEAII